MPEAVSRSGRSQSHVHGSGQTAACTTLEDTMPDSPHLAGIHLFPIKSLDGVTVPDCCIGPGGGLALDRVWALYSEDGRFINGKSSAGIHLIRAVFAPDVGSVTLSAADERRNIGPANVRVSWRLCGGGGVV